MLILEVTIVLLFVIDVIILLVGAQRALIPAAIQGRPGCGVSLRLALVPTSLRLVRPAT